jgi:hypothetical protein
MIEEFYTTNTDVVLPKKYIIFDCNEIYKINFSQVLETSELTLKKSIDGTKTFLKYQGDMPSSIVSLNSKSIEYTHEEILSILTTSEWYSPNENN